MRRRTQRGVGDQATACDTFKMGVATVKIPSVVSEGTDGIVEHALAPGKLGTLKQPHRATWATGDNNPAVNAAFRVHARVLLVFALLMALVATVGTSRGFAQPVGMDGPAAPAQGEKIIYVDWNITASGDRTTFIGTTKGTARRHIVIHGSTVIRQAPGELLKAIPFELSVTDDWEEIATGPCLYEHRRWSIVDPDRYMGGPDEFWIYPWIFEPRQRADGRWYIEDPFNPEFFINGNLGRDFTYRFDYTYANPCTGEGSSDTETREAGWLYPVVFFDFGQGPHDLEGDPTGTVYTRDVTYTVELGDVPLTINFHATVRLPCGAAAASVASGQSSIQQVCGCAAYPPSHIFDASDPVVTSLRVSFYPPPPLAVGPDMAATFDLVATCEGRRVKNAELEVTVKPEPNSGGHLHDGNRPRGYLNGTEITDSRPSIKVKTDDHGNAEVRFEAGKDLQYRLRGIAGIYVIKARSTRFPYTSETSDRIDVLVYGLQELGLGANYQLSPIGGPPHPRVLYGTPATLNAVRQLADAFRQRQEEHNADLRFYGKPEWPIAPTKVLAISLEDGGLFDLPQRGWWRIPFGLHGYGLQALIVPSLTGLGFPVPKKEVTAWMEREFRRLGEQYGTWYSDGGSPWNLAVEQRTATRVNMASTADGPDLATVVFLSDPADRYAAGVGQTVTYTVGVENLARSTQAHNVVLTATLPSELTFLSANPAPTRMAGANQPVWELGTLDAEGVPRLFDVVAEVGGSVAPGTMLTVTAEASTSDADANPSDNQSEAFGLLVQPPGPDLVVRSDIAATAMTVGQPIPLTLEVANAGNAPAADVTLSLTLPDSVTLDSASPAPATSSAGRATWNLGSLAPDTSKRVTVTVSLDPALLARVPLDPDLEAGGVLTYTLQAESVTPDIDLSNNVEEVVKRVEFAGPDLSVSMNVQGADGPGMLSPGQDVTYTLLYGNAGNQMAPATTLSLSLWSGLELVSAQPAPSRTTTSPTFAGGVLGWDLGDLPVGEWGMVQVQLHVASIPPEGSLVLAVVGSGSADTHPVDNTVLDHRTIAVVGSSREEQLSNAEGHYQLAQNYPNPFILVTTIEYTVSQASPVKLEIYNLLGQKLRTLVDGFQVAGRYVVRWDGLDGHGHRVPSGVYLYQLRAGQTVITRKMTLMK